ncbi:MAG: hypothetical protein JWN37_43 [Candidatus Nomurabacteria bacterium]|nr:hypothetical protein [Candidatus Nomurabacteria bacterium]
MLTKCQKNRFLRDYNMEFSPERNIESPPEKILEIGAGFRPIVDYLKKSGVNMGFSVISDMSAKAMLKENNLNDSEKVPRVIAKAYNLPFRDGEFKYILARNFFGNSGMEVGKVQGNSQPSPLHGIFPELAKEHLKKLFSELARVLSLHGEIVIMDSYTPDVAKRLFIEYADTYEDLFTLSQEPEFLSNDDVMKAMDMLPVPGEMYALRKKTTI